MRESALTAPCAVEQAFHVFPDRPALIQDNCALLSIPPPDLYFGGSEILGPLPERALKEQSVFLAGPHASEAFLFLVLLFQQTDKLLLAPVERLCGPRGLPAFGLCQNKISACTGQCTEHVRFHAFSQPLHPVGLQRPAGDLFNSTRSTLRTWTGIQKDVSASVLKIHKEGSPVSSVHPLHGPAQGRGQHRPFVPVSQRFSEIFTGRPGGL